MDGSIIRKSLKKMLEVLVAQYPLSDVWALPGVSGGGLGGSEATWSSQVPGALQALKCPVQKGETQMGLGARGGRHHCWFPHSSRACGNFCGGGNHEMC